MIVSWTRCGIESTKGTESEINYGSCTQRPPGNAKLRAGGDCFVDFVLMAEERRFDSRSRVQDQGTHLKDAIEGYPARQLHFATCVVAA